MCSRNESWLLGWNEGRGEVAKGQIIWCLKTAVKTLVLIKVGDGLMLYIQLWLVLQQRCSERVWEWGQEDEAEVSMEAFSSECDLK